MPRRMRQCQCECGGYTRGGRFLPGHDAKLKSRLLRSARAGERWAIDQLESLGWLHFLYPGTSQPVERTFGVEIECFVPSRQALIEALAQAGVETWDAGYTHRVSERWKVVSDGSLGNAPRGYVGVEVVSPVLRGEAGFADLQRVTGALASIQAKINRTCGLHVHHGAQDLTLAQIKRLVTNYSQNQSAIDSALPASRRNNTYCRTYNQYELDRIMDARNVRQIAGIGGRYRVVNLAAYPRQGTVELRQHSGTTDYDKIRSWVLFGQAMVEQAKRQQPAGAGYSLGELVRGLGLEPNVVRYFDRRVLQLA